MPSFILRLWHALRNRSGHMLPVLAVSFVGTLPLFALAVDVGMLFVARAESQRAADAAALAGAAALMEDPADEDRVRRITAQFATANVVRGQNVSLRPEDIVVSAADSQVTVFVRREAERGEPVKTLFARIIGIDGVDVGASATAGARPTATVTCLKPFFAPDLWDDADGDGAYTSGEYYDPRVTGYGSEWRNDGYVRDRGRPIVLYPGDSDTPVNSSWYFLMRTPEGQGANWVRNEIERVDCGVAPYRVSDTLSVEPGKKSGPVREGIRTLIDLDPYATWDPVRETVVGSAWGDNWVASPRVATVALFDPRDIPKPGMRPVSISSFISVFLESGAGGQVRGRVLPVRGSSDPHPCLESNTCAPNAFYVRLLQ